ncbi:hypothetical protein HJC23_001710 [Cyclotella cryptica]|uniref:DNA-directed RNA polymerase III subunit RPC5 n=1 Tax=Cyclotella cryptica TaxID=29204 RepID=A0ABD3NT29_9STRA|eukprot:CCRYP_020116-RA/>CCRYP_020116-RA protein AED:0.23 eAED:0.23 QI:0/-1/0/1/-1/1/1/0/516
MSVRPDVISSSGVSIKSEPLEESPAVHPRGGQEDDPIIRTIDVYISPELSSTLHLLQFPIQPAATASKHHRHHRNNNDNNEPIDAKFRPQHRMLELQYAIPNHAKAVPDRPMPDTMCLSSRTFTSSHIAPVTHMALAKLDKTGSRLDVVPIGRDVLQMRPSFQHLHLHDDDDDDTAANADATAEANATSGRQKPLMMQKKENEWAANARKNSYAYQRASEESEDWIPLEVHGNTYDGRWTPFKKDVMKKVSCTDRGKDLQLSSGTASNEAYVRSLNYLDSVASASFASPLNENLSDWVPSNAESKIAEMSVEDEFQDFESSMTPAPVVGATERAAAELAAKLAVLLQNGDGTMIPYRVIRSRFNTTAVSDEILTMALSSCAVLVRGNFCLKSSLAQFINVGGSGSKRGRAMRELRDLILLLLNMHGMVQRERLIRLYAERDEECEIITPDTITFLLQTVAKRSVNNCWSPKVEDDEKFAAMFPEVAAFHGVYWVKKKEKMKKLVEWYECLSDEMDD